MSTSAHKDDGMGTVSLLIRNIPTTLRLAFDRLAEDHGLTPPQAALFLLQWAVNEQTITPEVERRAS